MVLINARCILCGASVNTLISTGCLPQTTVYVCDGCKQDAKERRLQRELEELERTGGPMTK